MRGLIRLIVFVAVSLTLAKAGSACSCMLITTQEGSGLSDIVFRGELVAHRRSAAVFRVHEQWKGNLQGSVEIEWRRGDGGDCNGFWPNNLKIGNELLVFATKGPDGVYRTSICLPTKLAAEAAKDFHELGRGKPPGNVNAGLTLTTDKVVSFVLLGLPLLLSVVAWLVWALREKISTVQASRWRRIAITIGLVFLSADVTLSIGYLYYEFSSRVVKWSVFDTCSSIGAIACLIGIIGAIAGKGATTRLLLLFGSSGGMLFWYLTVGPR